MQEASKRLLIDLLLSNAVLLLLTDSVESMQVHSVKLWVEEAVHGSEASGPLDYVFRLWGVCIMALVFRFEDGQPICCACLITWFTSSFGLQDLLVVMEAKSYQVNTQKAQRPAVFVDACHKAEAAAGEEAAVPRHGP